MERSGMSSPTSCDLSHVIKLYNETEITMPHRTRPWRKHIVARWAFCRPFKFNESLSADKST